MSEENAKTPNRRRLLLIGAAVLAVAGGVVAKGMIDRAHSAKDVAQWASTQAVPTVTLAKLDHGGTQRPLTLPGTIQAYQRAPIYARVPGYLKEWRADIGAQVKTGQVLATIDAPDLDQQLEQAEADLATATANANLAATTASRWMALGKSKWVSQQDVDNRVGAASATKAAMESASANVKRLQALESFKTIVAPFDGTVTARQTDIGALINAGNGGQELFEVSDLHKVRIYLQVPQAFSADIQPGVKATFEMPQYPGQQFEATVVARSNAMDAMSRSMLVELQADNPEGKFSAGAYCQVHLQLPGNLNVVRVPAAALIVANRGVQVALLGSDNKAILRPVQLGRDFGDTVEVLSGLSPSDPVIDSPPETLQSGDVVRLASTSGPPGTPAEVDAMAAKSAPTPN